MARRENEPKTPVGARLREIRRHFGDEDRDTFAAAVNISRAALAYYERGERTPDAVVLAAYRERYGININWLLTGEGEMFADPAKAPAPKIAIDPRLMERLYKDVDAAYIDIGQKAPKHRVSYEASLLYNELLSKIRDVRDIALVDLVVPTLIEDLKKRLKIASEEPGTGKRLA